MVLVAVVTPPGLGSGVGFGFGSGPGGSGDTIGASGSLTNSKVVPLIAFNDSS